MTVGEWKELLKNHPDNMPVCIKTFKGSEEDPWAPPADIEVENVSISKHLSTDKTFIYETLDIIMG